MSQKAVVIGDVSKFSDRDWVSLIDGLLKCTEIEKVNVGEKIFMPESTDCSDKDCDFAEKICPKGKIHYQLRMFEPGGDGIEYTENILKTLPKLNLETKLKSLKRIILHNTNREPYDEDHRGTDHIKVKMDWNRDWMVSSKSKFTVRDLVEAIYRIKSRKWDTWSELFTDVKIKKSKNILFLNITFDYGS